LGGVGGVEAYCGQRQHLAPDKGRCTHQLVHPCQAALNHGVRSLVRERRALAQVGVESDEVGVAVEPEVEAEAGPQRGGIGQSAVVGLETWDLGQQLQPRLIPGLVRDEERR